MAAVSFESGHADMVHDAQLDYYGRRLATCSSDRTIKIFEISGENRTPVADLRGHEGPVWQISWAHPKFGTLLASCSFDHKVIIWRESPDNQWSQVYQSAPNLHSASINSVCWAPHELGLLLATASSDGTIGFIEYSNGTWTTSKIDAAHSIGCTAVSWSPAVPTGALVSAQPAEGSVKRLVSSGCDNTIKVWKHSGSSWENEATLTSHTDWVRDVAWAPNLGLPYSTIASAGQDGQVLIWTEKSGGNWEQKLLRDFQAPVWRVSWSVTGSILAVTDSSNAVTLWKETLDGKWQQISQQ